MAVTRFSISLDQHLLAKFDRKIRADRCPTRSKAIGDLIREALVRDEWRRGAEVAGAIVLVYDPHHRDIMARLTAVQHACQKVILSSLHIHLDHDHCLEIVAVRGKPGALGKALRRLKAIKGLQHVSWAAATTGRNLA